MNSKGVISGPITINLVVAVAAGVLSGVFSALICFYALSAPASPLETRVSQLERQVGELQSSAKEQACTDLARQIADASSEEFGDPAALEHRSDAMGCPK